MNLRDAFKSIQTNIMAGNTTVLKGPPGFGKSDLILNKVAPWYRSTLPGKRVGLSVFFMATQTPIGFTGLPWKGERTWRQATGKDAAGADTFVDHKFTVTDPAIPQWYMATCLDTGQVLPANLFDSVILVIEEWGQGGPETKRAGAEVLRSGGTPPFYLPAGSPVIASSNVDARDGVTKEFDFIIGRRGEIEVTPDVDIWVEDFADKPYHWRGKTWSVLGVTKAWAKQHPEVVFEAKPDKQGPWCSPRTITAADRYVQAAALMNAGTIPVSDSGFIETMAGHIGMGAAVSYCGHLQFVIDLPSYEKVVADPAGCEVPGKADLKMLMAYELAGRCKVEHLSEVIQYMSRLPTDMSVTFVSSLLRRDYKSIINQPAMQAWVAKNARLVSIIAALSN